MKPVLALRARFAPLAALAALIAPLAALPLVAAPLAEIPAEIYILGEIHDNPDHHRAQADAVAEIAPSALVFEQLTADQAARVTAGLRGDAVALADALDWEGSGWPDFAMYYPIFAAAPDARIYGAGVPREDTREAMKIGVPRAFGAESEAYGLARDVETEELAARLNMQMDAHCGALPLDMLPAMVDLQRLRDAVLARTALAALDETGGPVAVITGNGHARRDWGVPSYLIRVAPRVTVAVLGQGEDGQAPEGGFDLVLDAPSVDREDPCAALR